ATGVEDSVVRQTEEHQARDDEREVPLSGALLHPAAEAHAEDHEVEGRRDERAQHRLPWHAQEAAHLLREERLEADGVHVPASSLPWRISIRTSSRRLARVSTSATGKPPR